MTTGDGFGAGTDANVSLILFGAHGDSGVHELAQSADHLNKFERGHTDTFVIKCVDLGVLCKLRIWHDRKGLGSSWFLHKLEVQEDESESW